MSDLRETAMRAEIEDELRATIANEQAQELAADRDRRVLALVVTGVAVSTFVCPALGIIVGASIRVFRWAANL
jgi:hypothetical protein